MRDKIDREEGRETEMETWKITFRQLLLFIITQNLDVLLKDLPT